MDTSLQEPFCQLKILNTNRIVFHIAGIFGRGCLGCNHNPVSSEADRINLPVLQHLHEFLVSDFLCAALF